MRSLLLFAFAAIIAISSCTNNTAVQETKVSNIDSLKLFCQMPDVEHLIKKVDTVRKLNKLSYSYTVHSYDAKDRLIKEFYFREDVNDSTKTSSSTVIYDTAKHVVYQNLVDKDVQFQCYLYSYHSDGSLASKEGYGSGQSGIREEYPGTKK